MSSQNQDYKSGLTTIQLRERTRDRLKARKRGGESYDATLTRILTNTSPGVGPMTDTNTSANFDIIRKAIESKNDGHLQVAQDHIQNLGERRSASLDADFDAYASQVDAELEAIEDDLRSSDVRLNDERRSSSLKSAELAPKARRLETLLETVEAARGDDSE